MAGKAIPILDDAEIFTGAADAVGDCQYVLATTARARAGNTKVLSAREAMAQVRAREARGERCAILFGPERTGLENEEISLADAVLSIPVSEEYASLNLAQAVVVVLYEWFSEHGLPPDMQASEPPAPREELFGLFDQLEAALDRTNFWRVPEKKEIMWRHLRATLTRTGMTSHEVATWRGLFRALIGGRA